MDVAILGSGTMARIYGEILAARPDCRIRAVVGNRLEKTEEVARAFGAEAFPGGRFEEMYARHPEVGVTVIATPEWIRDEPVECAARAGQHILLEKPFAIGMLQAERLAGLLKGLDRVVELGHVLRFSSRFRALEQAVASGAVGALRHMLSRRNSNQTRVQRVLGRTDLAYWLTPHDIDMCRFLLQAESPDRPARIEEVYARSRSGLRSQDDYLLAHLRFAGPVDALIEVSWCHPPLSAAAPEARFEVRGTRGFADVADSEMNVRVFEPEGRVWSPDTYEHFPFDDLTSAPRRGIFEQLVAHFVARIERHDVSERAIEEGLRVTEICELIRRSLDSGKAEVPPASDLPQ